MPYELTAEQKTAGWNVFYSDERDSSPWRVYKNPAGEISDPAPGVPAVTMWYSTDRQIVKRIKHYSRGVLCDGTPGGVAYRSWYSNGMMCCELQMDSKEEGFSRVIKWSLDSKGCHEFLVLKGMYKDQMDYTIFKAITAPPQISTVVKDV